MNEPIGGIFGEQKPEDIERAKELRALLQPKTERRFIAIDPMSKLDENGRLAHFPGGTECEELNLNAFTEIDGVKYHGMYRGRWLKDMSQVELIALVLKTAEKLESERLEAMARMERMREDAQEEDFRDVE